MKRASTWRIFFIRKKIQNRKRYKINNGFAFHRCMSVGWLSEKFWNIKLLNRTGGGNSGQRQYLKLMLLKIKFPSLCATLVIDDFFICSGSLGVSFFCSIPMSTSLLYSYTFFYFQCGMCERTLTRHSVFPTRGEIQIQGAKPRSMFCNSRIISSWTWLNFRISIVINSILFPSESNFIKFPLLVEIQGLFMHMKVK